MHINITSPAIRHEMRSRSLILSDTSDFDKIREKVISSGVTKIGVNNSILAYYPWLYMWHGAEFDVRMINTYLHAQGESSDFIPEAVFIYVPAASVQEKGVENFIYEYNGQSYSTVAYAFNIIFDVYNILLMPVE